MSGAAGWVDDRELVLSGHAPSRGQVRLAAAVVGLLALAFLAARFPLREAHLRAVALVVPAYATTTLINDGITAVLLFAQFSMLRSLALLAISTGYLFTALIAVPWMLTFPGVAGPGAIAGLQTAAWISLVWHTGFPLSVLVYTLLKDGGSEPRWTQPPRRAVVASVCGSVGAAILIAAALIAADGHLPTLVRTPRDFAPLWSYAAAVPWSLSAAAALLLWMRRRSVLDLWLLVSMVAYVIEITLIAFSGATRFGVAWYAARAVATASSSFVLLALLYETVALYARLLQAVSAQRRERAARLMTGDVVSASIGHELKQPLAAVAASAAAGRRWLERETPDLGEAIAALDAISKNTGRATALIESTRAMFRNEPRAAAAIDMAALVFETAELLDRELRANKVAARIDADPDLPPVAGDRLQLQQVLVNVISNAVESMATVEPPRELAISVTRHEEGVLTLLSDTGPGVAPEDLDSIFQPRFTTKSQGMGMGLAICRSIVETHGGRMWVTPNHPRGATFHLLLPHAPAERTATADEPSEAPDAGKPIAPSPRRRRITAEP